MMYIRNIAIKFISQIKGSSLNVMKLKTKI